MSKALSLLALIAGLAVCTYLAFPSQALPKEKIEKKVSGAYQALDFSRYVPNLSKHTSTSPCTL